MIKQIIQILPYAKAETERIQIAKGKYKLPETFKEGVKQLKNELEWQDKSK